MNKVHSFIHSFVRSFIHLLFRKQLDTRNRIPFFVLAPHFKAASFIPFYPQVCNTYGSRNKETQLLWLSRSENHWSNIKFIASLPHCLIIVNDKCPFVAWHKVSSRTNCLKSSWMKMSERVSHTGTQSGQLPQAVNWC